MVKRWEKKNAWEETSFLVVCPLWAAAHSWAAVSPASSGRTLQSSSSSISSSSRADSNSFHITSSMTPASYKPPLLISASVTQAKLLKTRERERERERERDSTLHLPGNTTPQTQNSAQTLNLRLNYEHEATESKQRAEPSASCIRTLDGQGHFWSLHDAIAQLHHLGFSASGKLLWQLLLLQHSHKIHKTRH